MATNPSSNNNLNTDNGWLGHYLLRVKDGNSFTTSVMCKNNSCFCESDLTDLVLTGSFETLSQIQQETTNAVAPVDSTDPTGSFCVRDALAEQANTNKDLLVTCLSKIATCDIVGVLKHRASVDSNDTEALAVVQSLNVSPPRTTATATSSTLLGATTTSAVSSSASRAQNGIASDLPRATATGSATITKSKSNSTTTTATATVAGRKSENADANIKTFQAHLTIESSNEIAMYDKDISLKKIKEYVQFHTRETGLEILQDVKQEYSDMIDNHRENKIMPNESFSSREVRLFAAFAIALIQNQVMCEYPFKFHVQAIVIHDFLERINDLYEGFTRDQVETVKGVMEELKKDNEKHKNDKPLMLSLICNTE